MEQNLLENEYIPVAVFYDDEVQDDERDEDYYDSNSARKRVFLEQKEAVEIKPEPQKKQTLADTIGNFFYYHKGVVIAGVIGAIVLVYVISTML